MKERDSVRAYFQRYSRHFDNLYRREGLLPRLLNRWIRQPFYRRFQLTMAACGDVRGKRILDVGCGSGRYAVALAEKGAEVVGVDFAANMLALAHELAEARGVASRCRFIHADFLDFDFSEEFDISMAIGLFDYVPEPLVFLQKLSSLTKDLVIVTFAPPGWRSAQRWLRYRLRGCPVHIYSQQSMESRFVAAGFQAWWFVGSWAAAFPPNSKATASPSAPPSL